MVVSTGLGVEVLMRSRGSVGLVGLIIQIAVQRLASEEGSSCLVVMNFGRRDSRRRAAEVGELRGGMRAFAVVGAAVKPWTSTGGCGTAAAERGQSDWRCRRHR